MSALPPDSYVKVGPYNTRYWEAGRKGSAVLLVHGLGGSVENWSQNIGPLSKRHRVYALDLPGFGRTDKAPIPRTLYDLVDFIAQFMGKVGIDKASLAGNSLGGGLVLQFAAQYPALTEKLILADSAGLGRDVRIDLRACAVPCLGEWLTRHSRNTVVSLWRKIVYDPALVSDELVDLTYELYRLPGAREALLTTLRAGIDLGGQRKKLVEELRRNLPAITAPVLITWGRQDGIIPLKHAEAGRRQLARSEVYVFEECGHMPQFEHPDLFNELALRFLAAED